MAASRRRQVHRGVAHDTAMSHLQRLQLLAQLLHLLRRHCAAVGARHLIGAGLRSLGGGVQGLALRGSAAADQMSGTEPRSSC